MATYNKVLIMGNLTRDPELKQTPSSQSVAQIGIAMNRKFKDREGNMREETTFVDCEAWGRTAEVMAQYLSKGKPVFVEGRLKLDQWQDKDGGNRSKLKVVIESFQFIDSKGGQSSTPPATAAAAPPSAPPAEVPLYAFGLLPLATPGILAESSAPLNIITPLSG